MKASIASLGFLAATLTANAAAAGLTLWSAGAMKAPIAALLAKRDATLQPVDVTYATAGALRERLAKGEAPDVVILPSGDIYDLMVRRAVDLSTRRALGQTGIGVAVRTGAPIPDISTPEALKATLLAATRVVIVDPAKGTSGKLVETLFRNLRIADAMKDKTLLVDGGNVVEAVARGEADLGLHQISEILPVAGVTLVGPLPLDLKRDTRYDAAMMSATTRPADARALIDYLSSKDAHAVIDAAGFTDAR